MVVYAGEARKYNLVDTSNVRIPISTQSCINIKLPYITTLHVVSVYNCLTVQLSVSEVR